MARTSKKNEKDLLAIQLTVENIQANEDIKSGLADFNVTQEKITEGENLYNTAHEKYKGQTKAYALQGAANNYFIKTRDNARKIHVSYAKIARKKFADDPDALELLDLNGSRKRPLAEFIPQARRFYENGLGDASLLEKLASVGLTKERLEAGLALVNETEAAYNRLQASRGTSQQATQDRNESLAAALRWRSEILTISEVALKDKPELLEKLGKH